MTKLKNSKILCIPDLHCPFAHKDAFKFLDHVKSTYKINTNNPSDLVICLGDEVDGNRISFHEKDPDIPFSASSELEAAIKQLSTLYDMFPKMKVVDSNHGSLVYRRARWASIPRSVIRDWRDILGAPKGWSWSHDLTIKMSNGKYLYVHHGLSANTLRVSQNKSMNTIEGHYHSKFEIVYWANSVDLFFGIKSGCLIDHRELSFEYGKNHLPKPILGCTIILDGIPKLIPMVLNKRHKWIGKII